MYVSNFDPMWKTRESYRFRLPVACTETHNSIDPMYVGVLRDGETIDYSFVKKRGKEEAKYQIACRYCGMLLEASSGDIIHETICKRAPASRNSNADLQHKHDDLCPFFLIIVFLLLIIFLFFLQFLF